MYHKSIHIHLSELCKENKNKNNKKHTKDTTQFIHSLPTSPLE